MEPVFKLLTSTASGWECLCDASFQSGASATNCVLSQATHEATQRIDAMRHETSLEQTGQWLQKGDRCPSCGLFEGGYVCFCDKSHAVPCWETQFVCGGEIGIGDGVKPWCVHGCDGKQGQRKKQGELLAIIEHISKHAKGATKFLQHIEKIRRASVRLGRTTDFNTHLTQVQPQPKHMLPQNRQDRVQALRSLRERLDHNTIILAVASSPPPPFPA